MSAPPNRRRRRVAVGVAGAVVVAVVVWATWAYAVIQRPTLDAPTRVDAVLVLGGLDGPARVDRALQLVDRHLTDTIVISMPHGSGPGVARRTCARPPAGVHVVCFSPDPTTTRGEARELGRLAAAHHWSTVAVVTSSYHISRARMIVGRCFSGTLVMLASGEHVATTTTVYQWLYQTLGFAKAEILRGC